MAELLLESTHQVSLPTSVLTEDYYSFVDQINKRPDWAEAQTPESYRYDSGSAAFISNGGGVLDIAQTIQHFGSAQTADIIANRIRVDTAFSPDQSAVHAIAHVATKFGVQSNITNKVLSRIRGQLPPQVISVLQIAAAEERSADDDLVVARDPSRRQSIAARLAAEPGKNPLEAGPAQLSVSPDVGLPQDEAFAHSDEAANQGNRGLAISLLFSDPRPESADPQRAVQAEQSHPRWARRWAGRAALVALVGIASSLLPSQAVAPSVRLQVAFTQEHTGHGSAISTNPGSVENRPVRIMVGQLPDRIEIQDGDGQVVAVEGATLWNDIENAGVAPNEVMPAIDAAMRTAEENGHDVQIEQRGSEIYYDVDGTSTPQGIVSKISSALNKAVRYFRNHR